MWNAFNYTKHNGIMKRRDYGRDYKAYKDSCLFNEAKIHFKPESLGMVEQDRNVNLVLKQLVSLQPISIAMVAIGILANYHSGIVTEDYLKCSDPLREVNHGVLLVGYGTVQEDDRVRGHHCHEYWIVRNSWGRDWGEEGFFRVCMDGVGARDKPYGTCLINKYATWPNLNGIVIEPTD